MSAPRTPVDRYAPAVVMALWVLLALLHPQGALITDSGRDLAWGLAIARGEAWPAYGPSLFGTWQLGPAWYFVLAAALSVTGSVGGTTLLVGVLAAAKVPLAWRLGREAGDAGLGLAFACFVALPGWHSLGALVLSHTALVETGVLATALCCLLALRRDRAVWLPCASLAFCLALHAHPTAIVVAPLLVLACWQVGLSQRRWRWSLATLVAFLLPLLPAMAAEWRSGWPQVTGTIGWMQQGDVLARWSRLPAVLQGLSLGQVRFVQEVLLPEPMQWLWAGAWVGVSMSSLAGLLAACLRRVGAAVATAGMWCTGTLLVVGLRDATPAWMVYALAPIAAFGLAWGWQHLWHRYPGLGATLAVTLALAGAVGVLLHRCLIVSAGVASLPSSAIGDIARASVLDPVPRFWLPAWGQDAALRKLCGRGEGVSLWGDLAAAVDFGQGVGAAVHCDPGQLRFGGHAAYAAAGVPVHVSEQLGATLPAESWGHVLWPIQAAVLPEIGYTVVSHTRYRGLDRPAADAGLNLSLDLSCEAGDLLVVTNLQPGLNEPFRVEAGTVPVLARTLSSHYLGCPDSGRFDVVLSAAARESTQAFVLRLVSGAGATTHRTSISDNAGGDAAR